LRSDRSGKSSSLKKKKKKEGREKKKRERESGRRQAARSRRGVRLIKYHEELGAKIATRTAGK